MRHSWSGLCMKVFLSKAYTTNSRRTCAHRVVESGQPGSARHSAESGEGTWPRRRPGRREEASPFPHRSGRRRSSPLSANSLLVSQRTRRSRPLSPGGGTRDSACSEQIGATINIALRRTKMDETQRLAGAAWEYGAIRIADALGVSVQMAKALAEQDESEGCRRPGAPAIFDEGEAE